jgi:hypothetical protein
VNQYEQSFSFVRSVQKPPYALSDPEHRTPLKGVCSVRSFPSAANPPQQNKLKAVFEDEMAGDLGRRSGSGSVFFKHGPAGYNAKER